MKIVESSIRWRGSIGDLATDVAYLLTREEGQAFVEELQALLYKPRGADKWQGKGHGPDTVICKQSCLYLRSCGFSLALCPSCDDRAE